MKIRYELKPGEEEIAFLEQELLNFNCSRVDAYAYENFMIKAIGDADSTIAGIHGQIGGGWLYIASLWVNEKHRGKGLGKTLLG